jgi:transcriptional regulator with XRE-family HTH domain
MIEPAQIRAARSLLGWSQARLGKEARVATNEVHMIEREKVTPRPETIGKVQKALEMAGVEFLPQSGVRRMARLVVTYEGPGSNRQLVEDFYSTLQDAGGEILMAHLKEDEAKEYLGESFIKEQIQKRKEAGITHRLLVRANDPDLIPPLDTYHIMPDKYFSKYPLFIYGSKLALLSRDPGKSVVIDDERFADSARKLFDFIWDKTKKVNQNAYRAQKKRGSP